MADEDGHVGYMLEFLVVWMRITTISYKSASKWVDQTSGNERKTSGAAHGGVESCSASVVAKYVFHVENSLQCVLQST